MLGEYQEDSPSRYDLVVGFLQVFDLLLNVNQTSNDTIFKELQEQDKVLNEQTKMLQEQTNEYLEKIIKQNEEIIALLKERE